MAEGCEVVLDSLVRAAADIRATADLVFEESIRGLDDAVAIGHEGLAAAVAEFADRWQEGADALIGHQHDIADRLDACAVAYAETDRAATARYLSTSGRGRR